MYARKDKRAREKVVKNGSERRRDRAQNNESATQNTANSHTQKKREQKYYWNGYCDQIRMDRIVHVQGRKKNGNMNVYAGKRGRSAKAAKDLHVNIPLATAK